MKQTILSFLFALLPLAASADAVEIDGIYYNLIPKGNVAEVTSNPNKYTGAITIPETVTYNDVTYNVSCIVNNAFSGCSGLTSIAIPNSVTSVGNYAFSGCSGLTEVHISDLAAWCKKKFMNSSSNPLCYAHHLYMNGEEVKDLVIPNSVVNIESDVFSGCSGLTSVTIPNSVTSIGNSAFGSCWEITEVHISDLAAWCRIKFESGSSNPLMYAHHLYVNGVEVKELVIPNSVTDIGSWAFECCNSLTSITIPNSVTSIGANAFYECSGLTSIAIPNSVTTILGGAFMKCSSLTSVTIPNSVTSIGGSVFCNCISLTSVTIPNSVASLGGDAFYGCSSLTSITIPNSVTSIGSSAFYGCSSLTSITIPNSVTGIGNYAFYECSGLTSIAIPNSVTNIGDYAFCDCSGLTSVTIGNSVTSIGYNAFYSCGELTTITIGSGVKKIDDCAFAKCPKLTDIYCLAASLPSIQANVFQDSYIEYATLHVPEKVMEKYQATAPWSGFQNIVSIENGGQLFNMTINVNNAYGKVAYGTTEITNGQLYFNVKEGSDVVLTLTPNEGFKVSKVTVNGEDRTSEVVNGQLTLSNVTEDLIVSVSFNVAGDYATITISDEGVVTFCPIGDVDFTTLNLKAYTGGGFNRQTSVLTMMRVYDVPAGTGLLVKGEPGIYYVPYSPSNSVYVNLLKGVTEATNINATEGSYVNYVLNNGSQGVGFYKVGTAGASLEAGRAYLQIPAETATGRNALKLRFDDEEEATAISDVKRQEGEAAVYDLQGRRVEQPQRGLYIRNGKKVIVK